MTVPIVGYFIILSLMLDIAGRDTVISITVSLFAAFLFSFAIFRVRINYPDLNITDILFHLLGKWGAKIVKSVFILYFLFLTILSFAALVDFVYIGFLTETPIIALIVWFLIFFLYASVKGYKEISLTAGILFLIIFVTGITIVLMDIDKKDWSEIFPLLEFGWSPPLWGSLILISVWVELLLLLCIPIKNIREKGFFLLWIIGILISGLTILLTTTGAITIFGLGQARNFNYPAQEILRIINFGFIDRIDIYGMVLMTFSIYIRCSLFFRISYELSLPENSSKWQKRILFFIFTVITFFGTLYLSKENLRIEKAIDIYTYMIILFPIPFILWFISWLKKNKTTDISPHEEK